MIDLLALDSSLFWLASDGRQSRLLKYKSGMNAREDVSGC